MTHRWIGASLFLVVAAIAALCDARLAAFLNAVMSFIWATLAVWERR